MADRDIKSSDDRILRDLRRAGGLSAVLLICFGLAFSWQSWRAEKAEQIRYLSSLAEMGERALDSYFSQFQHSLELLSHDLLDERGEVDAKRAQFLLKRFLETQPELPDVALVRLDGQILVTAKSAPGLALPSVANEPSFIAAREELTKGQRLSIARPMMGLVVKDWVIPFRYGARDTEGNLRFIITAGISLAKPQSFWKNVPLPEGAAAGLLRDDTYLVSRYPVPLDTELAKIYGTPMTGALAQYLRREQFPASGTVEGTGSITDTWRLFAFHRLSHYPLTFFATTPLSNVQAAWWEAVRFSYLLMFLLMAGGFAVYRATLKRQLAWESERKEARERELEKERALRDTLVREVHHRVKNALQGAIGLIERHQSEHQELKAILEGAVAQIYTLAMVHGLYARTVGQEVNLRNILGGIVEISRMLSTKPLDFHISEGFVPTQLARDESVPIALILNELVSNAIKHSGATAQGGMVSVRISRDADSAVVSIRNESARLPAGFDFGREAGVGTGLRLVRSLLPSEGCKLRIWEPAGGVVEAELCLASPVLNSTGSN